MPSDRRGLQPRKQPRQARAELTRQRILAAAAHVFAEHGYAAGTTNRIAAQARVSIGSLYQYYPNKDAILLELMTMHLDAGMDISRQQRDDELPDALEDIIRGQVRAAIHNHRHDPNLLRIMFEQTPRSPELLEKIARNEREHVAFAERLLARHPEVRVEDTHVAARLLVSTVERVVHHLIAEPDTIDAHRLEDQLVAMLTAYLTAPPKGDGGDGKEPS
ncbi:TetR/AcrR family transcriptional regulator [Streptomyces albus subsp. chlorinus]|uniref:TetR/AcrR family transcriptional regulator n=1 Tax=Streptomyces albus TaxID=1888 RepID=UPI00156F6E7E|nr:TetR/AcrR family transcriptional regulator [Streptomyces albus]NSC24005.1 TetR/AcrR family transcriptional regulator [Streptomyces albus subsp. chlorinus]